jgi:hypothetical protein
MRSSTRPPAASRKAISQRRVLLFPDLNYGDCCVDHDRVYWQGGTPDQRREADDALRQCIAAKGRPMLSHVVYWGVRLGGHGWLPTPWRWGFGRHWPDGYYSNP